MNSAGYTPETELRELKTLFKIVIRKAQPKVGSFITRNELMEVMGWNATQFKYNKKYLAPFGLIKASGYRMPYNGFIAYLESKSTGGNSSIKKFLDP